MNQASYIGELVNESRYSEARKKRTVLIERVAKAKGSPRILLI